MIVQLLMCPSRGLTGQLSASQCKRLPGMVGGVGGQATPPRGYSRERERYKLEQLPSCL